jgi:uncharacterized protein with HEPN domain
MSAQRTDADFLEDILISLRNAQKFIRGMTYSEFSDDEKTIYALIRAFEVIGEQRKGSLLHSGISTLTYPGNLWRE